MWTGDQGLASPLGNKFAEADAQQDTNVCGSQQLLRNMHPGKSSHIRHTFDDTCGSDQDNIYETSGWLLGLFESLL